MNRPLDRRYFKALFIKLLGYSKCEVVGLWCRKCYGTITQGPYRSLTEAGYEHLIDHERSEACMRVKEYEGRGVVT